MAAFGAEAIGAGSWAELDMLEAMAAAAHPAVSAAVGRVPRLAPWVAEITGPHPRYRLERRFLRHKTDYARSNSKGTRGIWWWWTLESGCLYETWYRTSWSASERRFITVSGAGDIGDVSAEAAAAWASTISA